MTELCIICKERPVAIKKRKLCSRCYGRHYSSQKGKVIWPISNEVIHSDIQNEVRKNPEYKKYIKNQANEAVEDLIKENKL